MQTTRPNCISGITHCNNQSSKTIMKHNWGNAQVFQRCSSLSPTSQHDSVLSLVHPFKCEMRFLTKMLRMAAGWISLTGIMSHVHFQVGLQLEGCHSQY
jgi:hypothetical protein